MADKGKASIVIKKIKKGGHGHHGGAWKVAYADFVTAMMAFFLLLWLLSATPAENLEGLADYFSPTMGVKDKMGIGFRGGKGVAPEGVSAHDWANQGVIFGAPPSGSEVRIDDSTRSSGDGGNEAEAERFSLLQTDLEKAMTEEEADSLKDFVNISITPEGLQIEIADKDNKSLFKPASDELEPEMKKILAIVAERIHFLPNYISIEGHTNSIRYDGMKNGHRYTNWELSADRANAARRFMVESGMDEEQPIRVVGKGDASPRNIERPAAAQNRRITIILLKNAVLPYHKQSVPEELVKDPSKINVEKLIDVKTPEQ